MIGHILYSFQLHKLRISLDRIILVTAWFYNFVLVGTNYKVYPAKFYSL